VDTGALLVVVWAVDIFGRGGVAGFLFLGGFVISYLVMIMVD
jgi:hypothetical protein